MQCGGVHGQEQCSDFPQRGEFLWADIGAFVLCESELEKPPILQVRSHNHSTAAAFTAPRNWDALLEDLASEVGVDMALSHFIDGSAQAAVRNAGFTCPTRESTNLEDPPHQNGIIALSDSVGKLPTFCGADGLKCIEVVWSVTDGPLLLAEIDATERYEFVAPILLVALVEDSRWSDFIIYDALCRDGLRSE